MSGVVCIAATQVRNGAVRSGSSPCENSASRKFVGGACEFLHRNAAHVEEGSENFPPSEVWWGSCLLNS